MDWWLTWHILQGVFAFGVMVLAAASIALKFFLTPQEKNGNFIV